MRSNFRWFDVVKIYLLFFLQKLVKVVFSILNKVTSKNFDTSLTKIRVECLNIDTEERLACVAEMFYEKVF